ncbi:ribonuclease P protein subunit Rpp30 [Arctopsyche grandis]|uniref:ribonuclease P protein subunit Rpp30 n=1 Tax=Arctopsyche grandis TaxID=121162 RepID=UPI00406D9237
MTFGSCGFCDLYLSENFDLKKIHVLKKLGYHTVAINQNVDESVFEQKKKKKNEPGHCQDPVPEPIKIPEDITDITILNRLTIEFSDNNIIHKMNQSENLKKFDILAVIPTSVSAFQYSCCNMDVDIISYKLESNANFKLNRKLYKQAVERGIYFEIPYAPALKSSNYRKNMISRAHLYHSIGKSANIILSSGALNEFQVRGPYDVINLCLILGLSEQQSKHVLTKNMQKVLLKADNRRRGKTSVFILQKHNINKRPLITEDEKINKKMKIGE